MLTIVRRVAKAMATVTSQREAFEAYCKERFGGFSNESGVACPKSKTVTPECFGLLGSACLVELVHRAVIDVTLG